MRCNNSSCKKQATACNCEPSSPCATTCTNSICVPLRTCDGHHHAARQNDAQVHRHGQGRHGHDQRDSIACMQGQHGHGQRDSIAYMQEGCMQEGGYGQRGSIACMQEGYGYDQRNNACIIAACAFGVSCRPGSASWLACRAPNNG